MLGGNRAMKLLDDAMHDLVHRLPLRQKPRLVGANRLRDVEMNIAGAEMAESQTASARHEGFNAFARAREKIRRRADRHADIVFDRAPFVTLHFGERVA